MSGKGTDRDELSEFQQEVLKSAERRLDHELEQRGMTRAQLMKGGMALAASVGLGALFAACGGDDDSAQPAPAPEEAPPAPAPEPAQEPAPEPEPAEAEVRTTLVQLEATIAPALDSDGAGGGVGRSFQQTYANVYEPLVEYRRTDDGTGTLVPDFAAPFDMRLAESIEPAGDLLWDIKLRQGVFSHRGNEFTADDVIWSWERYKCVCNTAPIGWFLGNFMSILGPEVFDEGADTSLKDEVVKIDDYTVRFKQFAPNELFPRVLAIFSQYPYDSTEAKKHVTADDPFAQEFLDQTDAAGFGPYFIGAWEKGSGITYEATPNYYRGQPQFTTVIARALPESANRLAAILSGDADVATELTPRELEEVRASDTAKVLEWTESNATLSVGVSTEIEPWAAGGDVDTQRLLRQALAYAMPYDEIQSKVLFGTARRFDGLISSTFPGAKSYPGRYVTDPAKAADLLAQAGYPNGEGLEGPGLVLYYTAERSSFLEPTAIEIQTALAAVGIEITLEPLPAVEFDDRNSGPKRELALALKDQEYAHGTDPSYMTELFYITGGIVNRTGYSNPELDEIFARAKTSTGDERLELFGQIQDILIEDLPWVPLFEPALQVAVKEDITGFSPRADLIIYFHSLKTV
jgi:peptide/nickel transport system substrate-binding protein